MTFRKLYMGTFYNDSESMYLYKAVNNRVFASAANLKFTEPFAFTQKVGAYDVWLVQYFDEEEGFDRFANVFCVPSGSQPDFECASELIFEKNTFTDELYCITSNSAIGSGLGSHTFWHPDAYYCVEDIFRCRCDDVIPSAAIAKLRELYVDDSSLDSVKYDYVTGEELYNICLDIGCEPLLKLNTDKIRSSHFVEDCYSLSRVSDSLVEQIMGGIMFMVGSKISLIKLGNSFVVSFSHLSYDWFVENINDIAKSFAV